MLESILLGQVMANLFSHFSVIVLCWVPAWITLRSCYAVYAAFERGLILDTTLRNLLSTMIKKMYDTVTEYLVTGDFQRQSAI